MRFGRRAGKTKFFCTLAADTAIKGLRFGYFAPENYQLDEPWSELIEWLDPLIKEKNRGKGRIRLITGGHIDFWTLIDNPLAGRGREYHKLAIDEAAFAKKRQMLQIWQQAIEPTMATTDGEAWVGSTPFGADPEEFFWACCNDPTLGFQEFHAPSSSNPLVLPSFIEKMREQNDPRVFRQEYLAEFIDWSGDALFDIQKMLVDGLPVPYPTKCDGVLAIIDSAAKDGKGHDGTAVIYAAINRFPHRQIVILDWDIIKIQGAVLIDWLPGVYRRLDELAKATGARLGSLGALIEDAGPSGVVLLQQALNKGFKARPIESKLTSVGKDARALSVSGYIYGGMLKFSEFAYDKEVTYNGFTHNHLLSQIKTFKIGDKDAAKRADDLLDCFTYLAALTCGDSEGF